MPDNLDDVRIDQFIQPYNEIDNEIGEPIQVYSTSEVPTLPEKAVYYRYFVQYIGIHRSKTHRKVEMRSKKYFERYRVYPEAKIVGTIEEIESLCRNPTEFSMVRIAIEKKITRFVKNRLGSLSEIAFDDVLEPPETVPQDK